MKPYLHPLLLLLLLAGSASLTAQPAGRLFHTQEERARLEEGKHRNPDSGSRQGRHYQGLVQPSHGPATLWLDGVPQTGSPLAGQRVGEPLSGQEEGGGDLLRGGRITVTPRP
ncbi:hypothetical protein [Azovibrio restrictus]|uniref:hypothetical protein n=1 Tax=Azovibrio restrictus TaxID=146938 RepID=UPI0026EF17DD|nr:hypothetical protein [Azovibrio restrictus]MDD3481564.1 hypothetical protein [Azovibrio restrictus]